MQSKIEFYTKSFSDFLPPNIHESVILSQITEDEFVKIISSLNSAKSTGPNSNLTKILKLLQVQMSKHLTDIFNLSSTTGSFSNSLKSAKVIPVHRNEKLIYNRIIPFLEDSKIIYYKQFGFHKTFSITYAIITLMENV